MGRTSCQYCGRSINGRGIPYKSQRSVEDHEQVCEQRPLSSVEAALDWQDDDFEFGIDRYIPTEIELTDSISIWR